ncbi:transmembrane protein, putative (macronuclear) [Tetrahymena thermophila SB210]|uniref:Transmembrane protein, putative n=1 Tax=Tetrahymena thermophila (strain SB210) TaxID=312017 RepID=Q24I76_TETTS|nr:transmembrane protein, putative [Tetrahymena thermophila SB210]EAS07362.2 transmembrane protein, putative [Tetrahymena thermophila SB210]|eukprot:XP_001027604.2 transmembrane protein, putative [Tetrahymena thermophila SB210]
MQEDTKHNNLFCIRRLHESKIFQQVSDFGQLKVCFKHQRLCDYKNISICVGYQYQCPISDIKFSNEDFLEGYEKLDQRFNNFNIFITRENQQLQPLAQVKISNENFKGLKNDQYYYDKSLEQNDKVKQNDFDIIQSDLQMKSDKIEKFEYVNASFLILVSVFVQVYKTCIVVMHYFFEEFSPFNKRDFSMMIMCLLSDLFYIYSTFYSRIEYYNYIDSLLSKGCFDAYGDIYNMKQNLDTKIEIFGFFFSSVSLIIALIAGSVFYFAFIMIKKAFNYLKSKFASKSIQHKQQMQQTS